MQVSVFSGNALYGTEGRWDFNSFDASMCSLTFTSRMNFFFFELASVLLVRSGNPKNHFEFFLYDRLFYVLLLISPIIKRFPNIDYKTNRSTYTSEFKSRRRPDRMYLVQRSLCVPRTCHHRSSL